MHKGLNRLFPVQPFVIVPQMKDDRTRLCTASVIVFVSVVTMM